MLQLIIGTCEHGGIQHSERMWADRMELELNAHMSKLREEFQKQTRSCHASLGSGAGHSAALLKEDTFLYLSCAGPRAIKDFRHKLRVKPETDVYTKVKEYTLSAVDVKKLQDPENLIWSLANGIILAV